MADKYMPEWAKRLEAWGRGMERKYDSGKGSHFCSNDNGGCKGSDPEQGPTLENKPQWEKNYNPVGDIVGQFISYLVITYVPAYFPGFFLTGWSAVYTVLFYSILVHVAVDVVLIFLKARPFYYLGQVVTNLAGIIGMVVLVTIFPFNFPGNIGVIVQFAIWIAIVIVAIVTLFDFLNIFGQDKVV